MAGHDSSGAPLQGRILKLEELTWKELDALPRDRTALFIPVSPLEEHGTHLPLGVDSFTAGLLAQAAAEEFVRGREDRSAVLVPLVPLGTWTFDFVGSVSLRQRTVRDMVDGLASSYARYGFRNIVITNGHGAAGHIVALEEAARRVSRRFRHRGVRVISPVGRMIHRYFEGELGEMLRGELEAEEGLPVDPDKMNLLTSDLHAGMWETSMMLAFRPELVKDEYKQLPPVTVAKKRLWFDTARKAGEGLGYLGYPGLAHAAIGRATLKLFRKEVAPLLDRLVAGQDVSAEADSPYLKIPLLRTDFWRWLGASLAMVLALVWWALR